MGKKKDIIDLEVGEDGVYVQKPKHHPPATVVKQKKEQSGVDSFFEGMDSGIDFLNKLDERLSRIFKR